MEYHGIMIYYPNPSNMLQSPAIGAANSSGCHHIAGRMLGIFADKSKGYALPGRRGGLKLSATKEGRCLTIKWKGDLFNSPD